MKYFILFTAFSFDKNMWRTDEKQILVIQKKKKKATLKTLKNKQTNKKLLKVYIKKEKILVK